MNLYLVYPLKDEWACYVFAESRNEAKSMMVHYFANDDYYIDYGCKTIKRDVGGKHQVCDVDCDRLGVLGIRYPTEEELVENNYV